MITLRAITLENRRTVFNLEVSEDQNRFVASNLSSVASCYVLATNGGHPFPPFTVRSVVFPLRPV